MTPNRVSGSAGSDYSQWMQRLFSMFPQGGPGIALLLLRVSIAAMFSISLLKLFGAPFSIFVTLPGLAISAAMVIGFLTPIVSFLICSSAAALLMTHLQWDNLVFVHTIINSAALGLLGPGAYSLDARLFGRRVMVLSSPKDSHRY